MTDYYAIITFESTHTAIATEKQLASAGLNVRLIPVPPQITAGCGLALRFEINVLKTIQVMCAGLSDSAFYEIFRDGRQKKIIPLA